MYDGIVNHVPTKNVPTLIEKDTKRLGIIVDSVPHRRTVEMMARELGVVSDFQAADILCKKKGPNSWRWCHHPRGPSCEQCSNH